MRIAKVNAGPFLGRKCVGGPGAFAWAIRIGNSPFKIPTGRIYNLDSAGFLRMVYLWGVGWKIDALPLSNLARLVATILSSGEVCGVQFSTFAKPVDFGFEVEQVCKEPGVANF